jgi:hypothetical protein
MKLRSTVLAFAIALPSAVALAQDAQSRGALFFNPIAVRVSNSTVDTSTYSFLGPTSKSRMFYGVEFGGYYNFKTPYTRLEVGAELRDSITHGNGALLNTFLIAPRIAYIPSPSSRLRPYIEPFVGAGTTRAPHTLVGATKAQYGVMGGLDWNLGRVVTFRTFEVGYSSLVTASQATVGKFGTYPSSQLINISSGLVFRIP